MEEKIRHTFTKSERLCGKTSIEKLLAQGRYGNVGCLRFKWKVREEGDCSRLLISVPKKLFKRAVKRNLFKRRIRESWRKQKHLIENANIDILISYTSKELIEYQIIEEAVSQIITRVNKSLSVLASSKSEE